jgi:hypothetical protein
MTTMTAHSPRFQLALSPTLATLTGAEARRFARHPLFVVGARFLAILAVLSFVQGTSPGEDPMGGVLLIALFIGVFGFIVAHRLTTSMRRTGDVAETAPLALRRRTAALCLACLVPAAAGAIGIVVILVQGWLWTPEAVPPATHVAWFADEPDLDVIAALLAAGPVACLGGPLLGVAVARWAPFRGSAVVGTVFLVFAAMLPSEAAGARRAMSPWAVLVDERVRHGKIIGSSIFDGVSPVWYLGFALCLCGLAAVAALLRDPVGRRPLLWTGGALVVAAVGCFAAAVS